MDPTEVVACALLALGGVTAFRLGRELRRGRAQLEAWQRGWKQRQRH